MRLGSTTFMIMVWVTLRAEPQQLPWLTMNKRALGKLKPTENFTGSIKFSTQKTEFVAPSMALSANVEKFLEKLKSLMFAPSPSAWF